MSPLFSASLSGSLMSGQAALTTADTRLSEDAQQIANPGSADLPGALLDSSQALLAAKVAVDIIKITNQMLGTLIDIHA